MNTINKLLIFAVFFMFSLTSVNINPGNAQTDSPTVGTNTIYLPLVMRQENYALAKLVITDSVSGETQEIIVQAVDSSVVPSVVSSPVVFIGHVFEHKTPPFIQGTNGVQNQNVRAIIKYDPYLIAGYEMDISRLKISYYDEQLLSWIPIDSTVNPIDKTIAANLMSLGFFAATYALPDNPGGLRLPFSNQSLSRIKIEEAMNYRRPTDTGNDATENEYRYFQNACGSDLNCMAHFPDSDRSPGIIHKALDFVDVQGGVFTVYAGVEGVIDIYQPKPDTPWFAEVAIKAKVKGRIVLIIYTHILPNPGLKVGESVNVTTLIGHTYQNSGDIWGQSIQIEGIGDVMGYCRPAGNDAPHPFPNGSNSRCYPAHLDFKIKDLTSGYILDPFDICQNANNCEAYYYPMNRFNNDLGANPSRGNNHLWLLQNDGSILAVDAPETSYPNSISNGSSNISMDTNSVNLRVCGTNLAGKTLYWQMWRGAVGTSTPRTWNGNAFASNSCIDLTDLDGAGATQTGVTYYTVVGIEPLGATEAAQQRTNCYMATGGTRLCDSIAAQLFSFFDNFSNTSSGWPTRSTSSYNARYRTGEYEISISAADLRPWETNPTIGNRNYLLSADMRLYSGGPVRYGFVFDVLDANHFYVFSVNPTSQSWSLEKVSNGWTTLYSGTSSVIKTGTTINRLEVRKQGQSLQLSVNGSVLKVCTACGGSFAGSLRLGLYAKSGSNPLTARYDNFAVTEIP